MSTEFQKRVFIHPNKKTGTYIIRRNRKTICDTMYPEPWRALQPGEMLECLIVGSMTRSEMHHAYIPFDVHPSRLQG